MEKVNSFIIYYSSELLMCVAVMGLLLILLRSMRYRKSLQESWFIFHKLCDVYNLDGHDRTIIVNVLKRLALLQPHILVSSLRFFDVHFARIMVLVDKSKRLYKFKSELLRIYSQIRTRLVLTPAVQPERRNMPRFRNVEPLFIKKNKRQILHEGLLLNISGGGVRFFTKHAFKKGSQVNISFDHNVLSTVSARVLDVMQRNDFFLVRAKYSCAYPKSC